MTKCIATPLIACQVDCEKLREELDFLKEDLRLGERQIEQNWLQRIGEQLSDLADTYHAIRGTCLDDLDRWDCSRLQELVATKLARLTSETHAVISQLLDSELVRLHEHRYFMVVAYGTVEQLEILLREVGRLSELNQKIYFEDQCKPLVCEQSIAIHSLSLIWSSILALMHSFQLAAKRLFSEATGQDDGDPEAQEELIQSLDFSTSSHHHHQVFLMDLIGTSWLQFNRLAQAEQLKTKTPLLCPCHLKLYFKTLEALPETDQLSQLLALVMEPHSKPSMLTQSVRRYGILPKQACFAATTVSREELAYFVVWHLYAVSRLAPTATTHKNRVSIKNCQPLLLKCASIVLNSFLPAQKQPAPLQESGYQISPHQEERLSLMLLMLANWCEKNGLKQGCLQVAQLMFSFFDQHWQLFNQRYLDNNEFRVGGLTVFQLFTKIIDEVAPLYSLQGHAPSQPPLLGRDEKQLKAIWDRIVERKEMPPRDAAAAAAAASTKKISVSQ